MNGILLSKELTLTNTVIFLSFFSALQLPREDYRHSFRRRDVDVMASSSHHYTVLPNTRNNFGRTLEQHPAGVLHEIRLRQ